MKIKVTTLTDLAVADDDRMRVTDVEFSLERPSYTSVTLAYLTEKYPAITDFFIIMGGDSFRILQNGKTMSISLKTIPLYYTTVRGFEISERPDADIVEMKAPLLEISATEIRKLIQEKKSIRYLMPENVIEEIEKGGYYRKIAQNKTGQHIKRRRNSCKINPKAVPTTTEIAISHPIGVPEKGNVFHNKIVEPTMIPQTAALIPSKDL